MYLPERSQHLFDFPACGSRRLRQVLLEAWERKEGRGGGKGGEGVGRGRERGGERGGEGKQQQRGGGVGGGRTKQVKSREAGPQGGKRTQKRGRLRRVGLCYKGTPTGLVVSTVSIRKSLHGV